jgi:glycosyltransferase involved in cell wall biosynthesis
LPLVLTCYAFSPLVSQTINSGFVIGLSNKLKIAVNATPLLFPLTGIGKYLFHLMTELESGHTEIEPWFFYGYRWDAALRPSSSPNVAAGLKKLVMGLLPRPYEFRRALESRAFGRGINRLKPDVYHEPNYCPLDFDGPTVITIHDLSCFRYSETHPTKRVESMRRLLPHAVERAARIVTDSVFVKDEVSAYFGIPSEKIVSIPLAASPIFQRREPHETQATLIKLGLQHGRYLLAVGTLEPRKNLIQVLNAIRLLPENLSRQYPLVVVGMNGWKNGALAQELAQLIHHGRLKLLGYVPDGDLAMLYAGATMLVYPSLYEGFGLPPLEAMASGIPVITSGCASLPEVVGEAGLAVHPEDVDGLSRTMHELLEDPRKRADLADSGLRRSRLFSWERCATETASVYEAAARNYTD